MTPSPFTLGVKNFKALRDTSIVVYPLTILCGLNNVGKSSLIQSLVLLRASATTLNETIPLNGANGMDLGKVSDVLSTTAVQEENLVLAASTTKTGEYHCHFDVSPSFQEDRYLSIDERSGTAPSAVATAATFGFTYLCAERHGPRDFQAVQSNPEPFLQIGTHGEYSADVISQVALEPVRPGMTHPSQGEGVNRRLAFNLERWMQDFFPDVTLKADRNTEADIATLRYGRQSINAEWNKPNNSGFGISYVLPILLAGLLAPVDGMIVVENPEAHLHPSGQSLMGRFLATVAATGVIVVVETHSDHILNGIRLACVDDHPITKEDVCIYNLTVTEEGASQIDPIRITDSGNLTKWPKAFFDQAEKDLSRILKARRKP